MEDTGALPGGDGDRSAMLRAAADLIDKAPGELARGIPPGQPTAEAQLLRDLVEDVARFAATPVLHEVTDPGRLAGLSGPEPLQQSAARSRVFSVYFPIVLMPARGWGYSRLDLAVQFNPESGAARPKAVEILPQKRFRTALEANGSVKLHLGAQGQFEVGVPPLPVPMGPVPAQAGAALDAHGAASLGLLWQPFDYKLQVEQIDHTDVGAEEVLWRITGREFTSTNRPAFVVLLQLPEDADELTIVAALRVYRNFTAAGGGMIAALKSLPKALVNFLKGGAPIEVPQRWDLAPSLAEGEQRV